MNLVYYLLNEPYELEHGNFYNFTIENIEEFRKIIANGHCNEYIKIYDGEKVVDRFHFVENSFIFTFEDKKILNKIIKDIESLAKSEIFIDEYYKVCTILKCFLNNLLFEYEVPLEINDEWDMVNILKSFGLKLKFEDGLFIEKIINYLKLYLEVFKIDIFIFVNLTQFLTENELQYLLDFLKKNKLLLINYDRIYVNSKLITNQILFDDDLCRIL